MLIHRVFVVLSLATLLAACGVPSQPSQADVNNAMATISTGLDDAPTDIPTTAIPLAEVNLESLVLQSGDLPSSVQAGQVRNRVPNALQSVPKAEQTFNQILEHAGSAAGNVTILLYTAPDKRDAAYSVMVKDAGSYAQTSNGVGEQSVIFPGTTSLPVRSVSFVRCQAVVDITLGNTAIETITDYAKRLDKRLQSALCS